MIDTEVMSKVNEIKQKLKPDSHFPKNHFIYFNESALKMLKNVFYFLLKALFVLQIFIFLF